MHRCFIQVEFEDCDTFGIVFYPKYLHYCERARSQYLREKGYTFASYVDQGFGLVVMDVSGQYKGSARLGNALVVLSWVSKLTSRTVCVEQAVFLKPHCPNDLKPEDVEKAKGVLFWGHTTLVCISLGTRKVTVMPSDFRKVLAEVELDFSLTRERGRGFIQPK